MVQAPSFKDIINDFNEKLLSANQNNMKYLVKAAPRYWAIKILYFQRLFGVMEFL